MLYLVRRYSDHFNDDQCGIVDEYTLVGIFSSKEMALKVKRKEEKRIEDLEAIGNDPGYYSNDFVYIDEVDIDKEYEEENQRVVLASCIYLVDI